MTESEKKIKAWRNERRNHCQFPTQASYDDHHKKVQSLRDKYMEGEISAAMAISALVVWFHYGEVGAHQVVSKWEEELHG